MINSTHRVDFAMTQTMAHEAHVELRQRIIEETRESVRVRESAERLNRRIREESEQTSRLVEQIRRSWRERDDDDDF
jgi:hypothetical protein